MPCMGPTDEEMRAHERAKNQDRFGEPISNLDVATRVACELATHLDLEENHRPPLSRMAEVWIERHRALDKKRRDREAAERLRDAQITKALKKLTPAERRLLDL